MSMRSRLLDRDRLGEKRRFGPLPDLLPFCRSLSRPVSMLCAMRGDLESDLDLRRPRSSGLNELMRRLVFLFLLCETSGDRESIDIERRARLPLDLRLPRSSGLKELRRRLVLLFSLRERSDECDSIETERRARLPSALSLRPRDEGPSIRLRGGDDLEGERFVEIVDTESTDDVEGDRVRLRSSSFFFKISSATPFLRRRSLGTSVVSFGLSFGLSNCCVLDGRDVYGRSWAVALHS